MLQNNQSGDKYIVLKNYSRAVAVLYPTYPLVRNLELPQSLTNASHLE